NDSGVKMFVFDVRLKYAPDFLHFVPERSHVIHGNLGQVIHHQRGTAVRKVHSGDTRHLYFFSGWQLERLKSRTLIAATAGNCEKDQNQCESNRHEFSGTDLVNQRCQLAWRNRLKRAFRQIFNCGPVDLVQIDSDRNPTPRAEVCGYEETLRIVADELALFGKSRLATERDQPVAMVIEKIISKYLLPYHESNMPIPPPLMANLGQPLAHPHQPLTPAG